VATFTCQECQRRFEVSEAALAKFPGWQPKRCLDCKSRQTGAATRQWTPTPQSRQPARGSASSREKILTLAEVLARYKAGPKDGVFTDGAADPNPGPGGWGAVYVVRDQIVAERWGHEPHTTNNRMELSALIAGVSLVPERTPAVIYTDSQLCVSTINTWAERWEALGWKRKTGEIKNLELVKNLYRMFKGRPDLQLRWIAAHSGNRWNEYADSLATAYRRSKR
jgi:ribonuclease HI